MNKKVLALTLVLALPASLTLAQRPGGGPPPGGRPPGGPGPGGFPPGPPPNEQNGNRDDREPRGGRIPKKEREREREQPEKTPHAPPLPLQHVLDADHDGVIAAGEIEKAPEVLTSLDKNHDGKLTPNEFLPPLPDGPPKRGTGEKEREWPFPSKKPPGDAEKESRPLPREAADKGGERPGQKPPGDREKNPERGGDGERPPVHPLLAALDGDHNREISADEIANSAKALLTLDRNADGQLGPREYLGRPPGERPDGDGPKPPRPPQEAE